MTRTHDAYRENTAGRADVADTPELIAYYDQLEALNTAALWTVANKIEPWHPQPTSMPMLWRYRDLRDHVLRSLELVTPEKAGRRVIYLSNSGRREFSAAVGWLYTGLQVMNPGEVASSHRHSASALRFIMEGRGAYTVVDGHKLTLGENDFVLTPNGTWHEHGVASEGSTCIWQDGLDIPLMNALDANFYEVHPALRQEVCFPVDDPAHTYVAPGLRPSTGDWTKAYSPLLKYEWGPTYEALCRYSRVSDPSPYDGWMMDYTNPLTGGPVMQTLGASMQLLLPGQHTQAHRHTGSIVYQCAKGSGYTVVDGQRFDWSRRDIFCVPSWSLHEHVNTSGTEEACLFSFNDLPVMRALGLYREQALADHGGHQRVMA